MVIDRVKEELKKSIDRLFTGNDYTFSDTLNDLAFDSLDKVETIMDLEKGLNIIINDDDAWRIINLPLEEICSEIAKLL